MFWNWQTCAAYEVKAGPSKGLATPPDSRPRGSLGRTAGIGFGVIEQTSSNIPPLAAPLRCSGGTVSLPRGAAVLSSTASRIHRWLTSCGSPERPPRDPRDHAATTREQEGLPGTFAPPPRRAR